MPRTRLALILCLASTTSVAQVAGEGNPVMPLEADCPVAVRATVEKNDHPRAAQRLEVTLTKWPSFAIVASRITVHGIAPVADSAEPPKITRSLALDRAPDYARSVPPSNVLSASTQQKEAPTGQELPPELKDILGPLTQPILIRSIGPRILNSDFGPHDSRWYAWVTGFGALNSIDLESVSYADGTSWHVSNGKTCQVSVGSSAW
jgi:hypothetical protein